MISAYYYQFRLQPLGQAGAQPGHDGLEMEHTRVAYCIGVASMRQDEANASSWFSKELHFTIEPPSR